MMSPADRPLSSPFHPAWDGPVSAVMVPLSEMVPAWAFLPELAAHLRRTGASWALVAGATPGDGPALVSADAIVSAVAEGLDPSTVTVAQYQRPLPTVTMDMSLAQASTCLEGEVDPVALVLDHRQRPCGLLLRSAVDSDDPASPPEAESPLQQAVLRFRAIFERLPVGICEADLQGRITDANPGFCRMLGYTVAELTQKTFQDITHPQDLLLDLHHYDRLFSDGATAVSLEKRYLHKNGTSVWVAMTLCLVRDQAGQPRFSLGLSQDISDRKRSEAALATTARALRQSEERYALAISNSRVGVWDWTMATDQLYLSANLAALLAHCPGPPTMADWLALVHPSDYSAVQTALQQHLHRETEATEQTFRLVLPDGRLRWMLSQGMGHCDEQGAVVRVAGTLTDITDLKQAEMALQTSHQRVQNILESITDAFFALDPQWSFTYLNQRAEVLLQRQRDQVLGHNFWYEFPDTLTTGCSRQFRRAMAQRKPITFEGYFDSLQRWFEIHVYPTQDGLAVYFHDITERIDTYERLHHQIQREQALNQVLRSIRESLDLDVIFTTAARAISDLLRAKVVHIQSYIEAEGWQVIAEHRTDASAPSLLKTSLIPPDHPLSQQLQRFEVAQVSALPGVTGTVGQWLLVPLKTSRPLPWGCLGLQRQRSLGPWQPSAVELVQTIADQLAIAIQQGETLQQARQELQERQRAEARLKEAQRIARTGSWEVDLATGHITWSEEMYRIYGLSPSHAPLTLPEQLVYLEEPDRSQWQRTLLHTLNTGEPFTLDGLLHLPEGDLRPVQWMGQVMRGSCQTLGRLFGTLTDITERKQIEAQLFYQAHHDPLTHIPNRAYFMQQMHRVVDHGQTHPGYHFAVLFVDLDRFKVINDSLGHQAGDELLVECAHRLKGAVRQEDLVARLGGDEFAILLDPVHDAQEPERVADRIHQALRLPYTLVGREIFVSASVGITSSLNASGAAEDVLRDADLAMYQAKAQGRGCSALFSPDMHEQVNAQLALENDLRRALERQELVLHYQPIVAVDTGELIGFEALVRWHHPRLGLVTPDKFIPLAEETGLILSVGNWIQRTACHQLRQWQECYPQAAPLIMSVNLSVKQFANPQLISDIDQVLAETGLTTRQLRLEITESALIDNPTHAETVLAALRQRGIRLCIDDFGTGYSSLSMVHQFPVHILKIDRSFVQNLNEGQRGVAMVQAVLALANSLGMTTVAEGVETPGQVETLRELGCPAAQGYWFAPPLVEAEAGPLIVQPSWRERPTEIV